MPLRTFFELLLEILCGWGFQELLLEEAKLEKGAFIFGYWVKMTL